MASKSLCENNESDANKVNASHTKNILFVFIYLVFDNNWPAEIVKNTRWNFMLHYVIRWYSTDPPWILLRDGSKKYTI